MKNYRNSFWIIGSLIILLAAAFSVFPQDAVSNVEEEARVPVGQTNGLKKEETPVQMPQRFDSNNLITATTYAFSAQNGVALEDMTGASPTTILPDSDDSNSLLLNIGFEFWYDGVRFTTFGINGNGFIKLGAVVAGSAFTNDLDSTTEAPKIAAFWDDLCVGSSGAVRYKTIGSAPNRKLIVEWNNMKISRNGNCTFPNPNNGTFQLWLFESAHATTPGVIQMVYGAGIAPTSDGGYSIGLQSGAATNFAAVTTATDTVSYVTANDTQLTAIPAGKSYLFTPNVPAAPTGLTFGASTATTNTLNWTDNAGNEVGYVVYRSTDNINFTFVAQTAAGATMYVDTGLAPNTNYFYRVFAVSEGALSTPALTGSQTTAAGGAKTCAGALGDWNNPATWSPAGVPTASDNVTISPGCTVIVNVADAVALNVTIDSGGALQSPAAGAVITNNLTVGGSVTNNGTLDFSTNGDTSAAILTFGAGGFDVTLGGTGGTTDVRDIVVAKGAIATVVEVTATNFTVRGVNTDVAGYLTLTSGTFKISGTFTMANRTFLVAAYSIPTAAGFWLNNPNYTVAGQNGSPAVTGLLRLTQGIYNVGTASGNSLTPGTNGQITIEGGTMNVAGRLQSTSTGIVYTQSGGTLNVNTIGNTATTASFGLTSATNTFNMTGGTIVLVLPSGNATPLDYSVSTTSIFLANPAGTTLQVGTGAAVETFRVTGNTPNILIPVNKTMNVGSGAAGAAIFFRGSTVTNNGAIGTQGTSSRFDWAASGPMSYNGTGTFGTAGAPFGGVGMSANSPTGNNTAINAPIILFRINMFSGGFTNSGNITFGNGGTSTTVIQIGNSTTPSNAGTFDVSPVYMLGTGGHILLYLRSSAVTRNTGFEIPPTRSVVTFTYDNAVPGHTLILTGGSLTITGVMTLTNGIFVTSSANLLTHNGTATRTATCVITTCYVDGPMRREYTAIGAYTFHVGENGYSPVLINVTATTLAEGAALGFPYLIVEAFDATLAGMNPPTSITRNWAITEVGNITADLTFTYIEADTPNTGADTDEADYRVWRRTGTGGTAVFTNLCPGGPCINAATNTAGPVTGITDFGRFTVGDNQIPVAASVNIAGRVSTSDGSTGIPKVKVTITGSTIPEPRVIFTSPFGYYNFQDLPVGTYVLTVESKQYTFSVPSRVITAEDNILNADFIANP